MRIRTAAAVSIFFVCYPRSHRLLPLAIPLSNGKRQMIELSPLHLPSCERRVDFNFAHSFIGLHALTLSHFRTYIYVRNSQTVATPVRIYTYTDFAIEIWGF